MVNFDLVEKNLLELFSNNPEELKHAKDTLNWLLIISPNADGVQRISALGHDVERAINPWKLNGTINKKLSKKSFRMEHSKRSAEIIKNLLLKHKVGADKIQRMENMVLNHEFGGNNESNIIRDADSLANLVWVDDMWGKIDRASLEGTMTRMFERMGEENKKFTNQVKFNHLEVRQMFESILKLETI